MQTTLVIGHKNPDTDSICSAICYAELKRRVTGESYLACRAGEINNETQYVLDRFNVKPPKLITSLEPKLRHVYFRRIKGIDGDYSLKQAWEHMQNQSVRSVPILTPANKVEGIVTTGDEARFYMEDQDARALSKSAATYSNIAETLQGEILVGDGKGRFSEGKVSVASANPEMMESYIKENDLVILGNREEAQLFAIDLKVSCIVVSLGAAVSQEVIRRAEKTGCTVIVSPLDSYTVAKLINQAVPVRHIMKTEGLICFSEDDLVSDVRKAVAKVKVRYFPVVDREGRQTEGHSRGSQRKGTGGGRHPLGRGDRDHRPSPHRLRGNDEPHLLPQPAPRLHLHHCRADVPRAGRRDHAAYRGSALLCHSFRHADVPLPHLHAR